MWQDTTKGNGGADQSVQFFVTTDSELQVARGDTLDLEILGSILRNVSMCLSMQAAIAGSGDST